MFFKKIKNNVILLILSLFIIPTYALAYSDYVIAGGENIGIELNSKGIIIVGTYSINNTNPAKEAGLQNGDKIIKINSKDVDTIKDMITTIENSNNNKLVKSEGDIYKTGLYVKDSITGVGTLTYIDPNTKLFGALGHEIIEKNTGQKLEIKDGKIYSSTVTGVTRSSIGSPGEKNARYDSSKIFGNVFENTNKGIFGTYTSDIPNKKLYAVAKDSDISTGKASIFTVVNNDKVEEFTINIIKINNNDAVTKNILFEVTDKNLLDLTGGIVQGMSGSPIIQGDYIIGAVTHVVVDDPTKGYGIFITKMLEEAEN